MAEGGGESDPLIDHTDDRNDDETFNLPPPISTSSPNNPSETFEMRPLHHEQSGLPDASYQETDFGGTTSIEEIERRLKDLRDIRTGLLDLAKIDLQNILLSPEDQQKEFQKVKDFIKRPYPNAKLGSLYIRFSKTNPNQIVVEGPGGGETQIILKDGSGLA